MHHRNELLDLADWIDGVQGAPGSKWSEIVRSLADGAPAQGALPQTPTNLRQSMLDAAKSAAPAQCALEARARVRELFVANPALLHEAVRNNTISGALNVTWADLAALTSTNPEIERCPDCGQELPIRYPCHEQGCMIKCRF